MKWLKYRKFLDAFCVFLWAFTPVAIAMTTFVTYTAAGYGNLTASKVFTSVALFQMMNGPLNSFPWVINGFVEAMVSIKRIGKYLDLEPTDRSISFDDVYDEVEPEGRRIFFFAHQNLTSRVFFIPTI